MMRLKKLLAVGSLSLLGLFTLASCGESQSKVALKVNDEGYWVVSYDSGATWSSLGVKAKGEDGLDGLDGSDGLTPFIGSNGNWWIGSTDTKVYAGNKVEEIDQPVITEKSYDLYMTVPSQYGNIILKNGYNEEYNYGDAASKDTKTNFIFTSDIPGVPFIDVDSIAELINVVTERTDKYQAAISYNSSKTEASLRVPSYYNSEKVVFSTVTFNTKEQTITAYENQAMFKKSNSVSPLTVNAYGSLYDNDTKNINYLGFTNVEYTFGRPASYDLDDFDLLQLISYNDKVYAPIQTINDFCNNPTPLYFNGEAIYTFMSNQVTSLNDDKEMIFSELASQANKNLCFTDDELKAIKEFTYEELCLLLDSSYGLMDTHHINSFDEALDYNDIKYEILNGSETLAIEKLTNKIIDDNGHTSFVSKGFFDNSNYKKSLSSWSDDLYVEQAKELYIARENANLAVKKEVQPLQIVDNTLYIAFDGFGFNYNDHYQATNMLTEAKTWTYDEYIAKGDTENYAYDNSGLSLNDVLRKDTVYLMSYALYLAKNSTAVKNVVVDLSINAGGAADAAMFVIGTLLGGDTTADLDHALTAFRNVKNNSLSVNHFVADGNLDGTYDYLTDTFSGYNIVCLESPLSFSCANLVPTVLKYSSKAKVIGQKSGGGSCVVQNVSTAMGTKFNISGPIQMGYIINSSHVSTEMGVEPDIYIPKFSTFYDRTALNSIINTLF